VAEKWVSDSLGPEAALSRASEAFGALGKLAQDLPQLVKNAEELSQMVAQGGVRLHPDTTRAIAAEQERRSRPTRMALIAVLGVIALVLVLVLRRFV
jgi:ubiquinone biosynthesis protein